MRQIDQRAIEIDIVLWLKNHLRHFAVKMTTSISIHVGPDPMNLC